MQATLPPNPIERSYTSQSLLARIIMAKFAEHLPLYRQSKIYARQGVELSRNTMRRWVDIIGEQLRPLYDELNDYVLMSGKVHADDTPVNVLDPGSSKTRTGHLWVYVRDARNAGSTMPAAVWCSSPPRIAEVSTRNGIWRDTVASCRPMHTQAITPSMKADG